MAITYLSGQRIQGQTALAIVKDTEATTNTDSLGDDLTNSSFTVANNDNRILIVCAANYGDTATVTGVTWNGSEPLYQAITSVSGADRSDIWYRVNPTATTADVVTTWSGDIERRGAGVYSFYNVKQSGTDGADAIGVTNTGSGVSDPTTGTLTPTTAGSMIVDCEISSSNIAAVGTLTAGWTSLINGDDRSFSSQYSLTPTISSSNDMFYDYPSAKTWTWCGTEIIAFANVDDKDSVTDVPVGSEFEQTDDYKNYQFDGTNWVERGTAL